jgi:ABC-type transporter Mla MlaB component
MGFFSKPTTRKPAPPRADAPGAPRPGTAYEVASQVAGRPGSSIGQRPMDPMPNDITVADRSMIDWATPGQPAFEVASANPGLCEVLENAALLYASGKADLARSTLEQGVQTDQDARTSPLAWLALFDLLQRASDRAAFDQMAMIYVVEFERSAPAWEERASAAMGTKAAPGGYVAISGKLTAAAATQIDGLKRAIAKNLAKARIDLSKVTDFDAAGAQLLATALGDARRARFGLEILHAERLRQSLEAAVRLGREGGEGAWLLSLEFMQWHNDRASFEDRAIEFAVAFELSPPSWEPPPVAAASTASGAGPAGSAGRDGLALQEDALRWSGTLLGSSTPQLAKLVENARGRSVIAIDMADVERVDFVCAAALLNTINSVELQRKSVQIVSASPIIRALLLLIGISPRHFVKKTD